MSNFKLLFPHIPFFDGFSSDTDSNAIVSGSPRNYFEMASADTTKTWVFSAGISPLLGTYGNPDYLLLLGINDLLDKGATSVSWTINTVPADSDTGAITSGDIVDGKVFYTDVVLTPAADITQYSVVLAWTNSIKLKLSKLYLGKAFDFGREPIFGANKRIVSAPHIRRVSGGTINFMGVAPTVARNFIQYIMPYQNIMTFFLHDAAGCYLQRTFTYCKMSNAVIEWNKKEATISFDFEELA